MTVDTSGAPVSGPIPSSTTRVAAVDYARLECELASGTGDRQEVEGGSPGCSPEDEGPRLQPLRSTRTLSSPVSGARPLLPAAARSWTRPGRLRPTASPLAPAHSLQLTGAAPGPRDGDGDRDGDRRASGCSALGIPRGRRLEERPPPSRSAQTGAPAAALHKADWARGRPTE